MEYTTKLATNAEMKNIQHFQEPKGTIHRRLEITINLNADWGTDQVYINLHKFTPPLPLFFDIFPSDFFQKKHLFWSTQAPLTQNNLNNIWIVLFEHRMAWCMLWEFENMIWWSSYGKNDRQEYYLWLPGVLGLLPLIRARSIQFFLDEHW